MTEPLDLDALGDDLKAGRSKAEVGMRTELAHQMVFRALDAGDALLAYARELRAENERHQIQYRFGTPFDPTGAKTGSEMQSLRLRAETAEAEVRRLREAMRDKLDVVATMDAIRSVELRTHFVDSVMADIEVGKRESRAPSPPSGEPPTWLCYDCRLQWLSASAPLGEAQRQEDWWEQERKAGEAQQAEHGGLSPKRLTNAVGGVEATEASEPVVDMSRRAPTSPALSLPPEILRGITTAINADFDCGAWEDGDDEPYGAVSRRAETAKQSLLAAIESWGHSLVRPSGDLREAAQRFLAKYDEMEPAIADAFAFKQGHGMTYTGPDFGEELKALRLALSLKESPK